MPFCFLFLRMYERTLNTRVCVGERNAAEETSPMHLIFKCVYFIFYDWTPSIAIHIVYGDVDVVDAFS